MLAETSMSMLKEGVDASCEQASERSERQPGLERDAVVNLGASGGGRQDPFVLQLPHAEHRGALEEAAARLDLDDDQAVVVEGDDAEQSQPGAPDRSTQGNRLDGQASGAARHPHRDPGTHLVVEAGWCDDPRPDLFDVSLDEHPPLHSPRVHMLSFQRIYDDGNGLVHSLAAQGRYADVRSSQQRGSVG